MRSQWFHSRVCSCQASFWWTMSGIRVETQRGHSTMKLWHCWSPSLRLSTSSRRFRANNQEPCMILTSAEYVEPGEAEAVTLGVSLLEWRTKTPFSNPNLCWNSLLTSFSPSSSFEALGGYKISFYTRRIPLSTSLEKIQKVIAVQEKQCPAHPSELA